MKQVGLVGVTGYTGMELARLLAHHPDMELALATSRSEAGKTLGDLFPQLGGARVAHAPVVEPEPARLAAACELVFLAIPHGTAMDMAGELYDSGVPVVDLSADFRLTDPTVYEAWYGLAHRRPELLEKAVYGLLEFGAEDISRARLVANPGCYPTATVLALAPALERGIIETDDIVVDAKSGTTGAGRGAKVPTLFCEVADTFRAYGLGTHRHTPEIEQEVSRLAGGAMTLSFNTHLLPINRGILTTSYARLTSGISLEAVHAIYADRYADAPWVRVLPPGALPETKNVRGTMFCDIGLVVDPRTNRLIVVSVIDNLCRGASGQALACANLMLGLEMTTGLNLAPMVP